MVNEDIISRANKLAQLAKGKTAMAEKERRLRRISPAGILGPIVRSLAGKMGKGITKQIEKLLAEGEDPIIESAVERYLPGIMQELQKTYDYLQKHDMTYQEIQEREVIKQLRETLRKSYKPPVKIKYKTRYETAYRDSCPGPNSDVGFAGSKGGPVGGLEKIDYDESLH